MEVPNNVKIIDEKDIQNGSYTEAELSQLTGQYQLYKKELEEKLKKIPSDEHEYRDLICYKIAELNLLMFEINDYLELKDRGYEQQGGLKSKLL